MTLNGAILKKELIEEHNYSLTQKWTGVGILAALAVILYFTFMHMSYWSETCLTPQLTDAYYEPAPPCGTLNGYEAIGQVIVLLLAAVFVGNLVYGIGYGITSW